MFEVTAKDRNSFDALIQLYEQSVEYDFWTEPRGIDLPMDIMIPPGKIDIFINFLDTFQMAYRVKVADVQT